MYNNTDTQSLIQSMQNSIDQCVILSETKGIGDRIGNAAGRSVRRAGSELGDAIVTGPAARASRAARRGKGRSRDPKIGRDISKVRDGNGNGWKFDGPWQIRAVPAEEKIAPVSKAAVDRVTEILTRSRKSFKTDSLKFPPRDGETITTTIKRMATNVAKSRNKIDMADDIASETVIALYERMQAKIDADGPDALIELLDDWDMAGRWAANALKGVAANMLAGGKIGKSKDPNMILGLLPDPDPLEIDPPEQKLLRLMYRGEKLSLEDAFKKADLGLDYTIEDAKEWNAAFKKELNRQKRTYAEVPVSRQIEEVSRSLRSANIRALKTLNGYLEKLRTSKDGDKLGATQLPKKNIFHRAYTPTTGAKTPEARAAARALRIEEIEAHVKDLEKSLKGSNNALDSSDYSKRMRLIAKLENGLKQFSEDGTPFKTSYRMVGGGEIEATEDGFKQALEDTGQEIVEMVAGGSDVQTAVRGSSRVVSGTVTLDEYYDLMMGGQMDDRPVMERVGGTVEAGTSLGRGVSRGRSPESRRREVGDTAEDPLFEARNTGYEADSALGDDKEPTRNLASDPTGDEALGEESLSREEGIEKAKKKLSPSERALVELIYTEGLTAEGISGATPETRPKLFENGVLKYPQMEQFIGMSKTTIRRKLQQAMDKIKIEVAAMGLKSAFTGHPLYVEWMFEQMITKTLAGMKGSGNYSIGSYQTDQVDVKISPTEIPLNPVNLIPDVLPQENISGDILRGYGPRRGNLEKLLRYWRPIMRKEGGFTRCRVILANHPELYPLEPLCAWLHHETTGMWPNEGCHHPGMKNCRNKIKKVIRGSILSDSQFDDKLRAIAGGKLSVRVPGGDIPGVPGKSMHGSEMQNSRDGADDSVDVSDEDLMRMSEKTLTTLGIYALKEFMENQPDWVAHIRNDNNWEHLGEDESGYLMPHDRVFAVEKPESGCSCGGSCGGGLKSLFEDLNIEVKVGRPLSSRNLARVRQAIDSLSAILQETGNNPVMVKDDESLIVGEPEELFRLKSFLDPVFDYHSVNVKVVEQGVLIKDMSSLGIEALNAISTSLEHLDR